MTGPSEDDLDDLRSFVDGLYDEMDKLAKKAPSAPLSDFAVRRVNRALADAHTLLGEFDKYAADIVEFVPAGDNPEVRDALLALGEVKQALLRVRRRIREGEYDGYDGDEDGEGSDEEEG